MTLQVFSNLDDSTVLPHRKPDLGGEKSSSFSVPQKPTGNGGNRSIAPTPAPPPPLPPEELEAPRCRQTEEPLFPLSCWRTGSEGIFEVSKIHHLFPAGVSERSISGVFTLPARNMPLTRIMLPCANHRSSHLETNQY